jgi:hypothetical protein
MSTIYLGSRSTAEQALRGASLSRNRAIVTGEPCVATARGLT